MKNEVRQALVVVHGMGEQRPLEALNGFIHAAIPPDEQGDRQYFSRPDKVTDSYESRRYLVPSFTKDGVEIPQTEVYEYHWAHLMQGNRLGDMSATVRRMLLQSPRSVPSGLKVVWVLLWAAIIAAIWAFWRGPFSGIDLGNIKAEDLIRTLLGGGIAATVLTFVAARIPPWITTSFVDVVRYLDTSPRSYEARRLIRKGMVDLLEGLHASGRYERIVVAAHSLGAYIAYDGIAFLWAGMNKLHDGRGRADGRGQPPRGLKELEKAASALGPFSEESEIARFQEAQRNLWGGLRMHGNPWLITDFVTVGTPMYFAHRLYLKSRRQFDERVQKRELPTCPPLPDRGQGNNINSTALWYTWNNHGRRVVYEGAPFAVVRWTNLWFPAALGFFGDWFGGPLAPLYGSGIHDVKLFRNRPWRWVPGAAHSFYFRLRRDAREGSLAGELRSAIDLPAAAWLRETLRAPDPDPRTAETTAGDELLPPRPGPISVLLREVGVRLAGWSEEQG